jgi:hypothetical protein
MWRRPGPTVVPAQRSAENGREEKGEVPEEDKVHPPRAAPGSRNLPWDQSKIPAKRVRPPGVGDWDGENASARGVGEGIGPGSGTNAIAGNRSARGRCIAGKPRSVSGSAVRRPKGVKSTRRRSETGGSDVRRAAARPLRKLLGRRPRPAARGHAANHLSQPSSATGQVVMSPPGTLATRRLPIAATVAARRCAR